MPSSSQGGHPYQLDFSGSIAEAFRNFQRQATREGRGEQFLLAARIVVERLQQNPSDFGEPLYRLPALRMQVRCVVVRPLYVNFAVCEDRPVVYIKDVKLLSKRDS